jgi:hypothetical protein
VAAQWALNGLSVILHVETAMDEIGTIFVIYFEIGTIFVIYFKIGTIWVISPNLFRY